MENTPPQCYNETKKPSAYRVNCGRYFDTLEGKWIGFKGIYVNYDLLEMMGKDGEALW